MLYGKPESALEHLSANATDTDRIGLNDGTEIIFRFGLK